MPLPKFHEVQVKGRSPEEIKASEEKKRKEEEEKKKKPVIKQKKHYDVFLEAMVPCTIKYRVLADDEHDAIIQMKNRAPESVKPQVVKKRDIKAIVYDSGSSIIRLAKVFRV